MRLIAGCLAVAVLLAAGAAAAKEQIIRIDVLNGHTPPVNQIVTVQGTVTQLNNDDMFANTRFYFLQDDYGGNIRIRTANDYPKVGQRLKVTGVVEVDSTSAIFLSEQARSAAGRQALLIAAAVGLLVVLVVGGGIYYQQGLRGGDRRAPVMMAAPVAGWAGQFQPAPAVYSGRFLVQGEPQLNEFRVYADETVIGRPDPPSREVPRGFVALSDMTVSRWQPEAGKMGHARLLFRGNRYSILNLSDTNPVQINGQRLGPNEERALQNGDRIGIARVTITYQA